MLRNRRGRRGVAVTGAALMFLAAGCSSTSSTTPTTTGSTASNPGQLVYVSPGGSYAAAIVAAYVNPFEEATGIKVEAVQGGDNPEAAVQAQESSHDVLWDLVACDPSITLGFPTLWSPIDRSIVKVPAGQLLYPGEIGPNWVIDDIEAFPVMAWLSNEYKGVQPSTWADFYNVKKFPGPRGVPNVGLDSAVYVPATALLAQGVPPSQLFPLNLTKAYALLDRFKPNIRIFWTGFSQSQDILGAGDVVMNMMTDGRAGQMNADGTVVDISFNEGFRYTASWCVTKDAPDYTNAMKFLNFILNHPRQQAVFTNLTLYGPPTVAGAADAKALGITNFSTLHQSTLVPDSSAFYKYLQVNSRTLLNRWNAYVGS